MKRNFAELLEAARHGSAQAQDSLFQRHHAALWRLVRRELGPQLCVKVAPSDLVQEACLTAHHKLTSFRGVTEAEYLAWISRILLRKLARARRHYQGSRKRDLRREVSATDSAGEFFRAIVSLSAPSPGTMVATKELIMRLRTAVAQLPGDYRQVVEMRNIHDRSFADIGAAIGRTEEATRKVWARALDCLARQLEGSENARA